MKGRTLDPTLGYNEHSIRELSVQSESNSWKPWTVGRLWSSKGTTYILKYSITYLVFVGIQIFHAVVKEESNFDARKTLEWRSVWIDKDIILTSQGTKGTGFGVVVDPVTAVLVVVGPVPGVVVVVGPVPGVPVDGLPPKYSKWLVFSLQQNDVRRKA